MGKKFSCGYVEFEVLVGSGVLMKCLPISEKKYADMYICLLEILLIKRMII